jgi:hypothetical protein
MSIDQVLEKSQGPYDFSYVTKGDDVYIIDNRISSLGDVVPTNKKVGPLSINNESCSEAFSQFMLSQDKAAHVTVGSPIGRLKFGSGESLEAANNFQNAIAESQNGSFISTTGFTKTDFNLPSKPISLKITEPTTVRQVIWEIADQAGLNVQFGSVVHADGKTASCWVEFTQK